MTSYHLSTPDNCPLLWYPILFSLEHIFLSFTHFSRIPFVKLEHMLLTHYTQNNISEKQALKKLKLTISWSFFYVIYNLSPLFLRSTVLWHSMNACFKSFLQPRFPLPSTPVYKSTSYERDARYFQIITMLYLRPTLEHSLLQERCFNNFVSLLEVVL